jgi:phosphoribosylglycinamide formyltransferase 1
MKTVSFLASGRGSNFQAIAEAIRSGRIPARIGVLISNVPDTGALRYAAEAGIAAVVLDHRESPSRDAHEEAMERVLRDAGTDLVCAAGYMRIIGERLIRAYPGAIMNIHPALLPAFPGLHAQRQALDYGVKVSGCTVHFVDAGMDTGPVVLQRTVPVLPDDDEASLSARILVEEHLAYPEAVRLFCEDCLEIRGRVVQIGG